MVSPGAAEPVAGAHQDEIASGVRKAASTAAAGAAKVLVLVKSGAGPVPSVCVRSLVVFVVVVMAGILSGSGHSQ